MRFCLVQFKGQDRSTLAKSTEQGLVPLDAPPSLRQALEQCGDEGGPLIINVNTRAGKQLVLSDRRFSTRHPMLKLNEPDAAVTRTA